jgi:PQQ enzyme repeat
MAAVTTRSYDNARSGTTTQETVLTPDAVGTGGIRKLFSLNIPGDRRGIESQPLIAPGVTMADGSTHDVVYLADMANQVWAFDAGDGQMLWKRVLGMPVNGSQSIDLYQINDHWGVLGTPVIDMIARVIYLVAWSSPDGSVAKAQHFCHALSLRDGAAVFPAVNLEGATYNPGHGLPVLQFRSAARKQRPGLLLTDVNNVKTVFIAFGSVRETAAEARGWVLACSTSPLAVTAAWASTARGSGGGIWHGAGGLAGDAAGNIYAMTGNGDFDGVTDFGESFVKLAYTPPSASHEATLKVVDWWTPFTDAARTSTANPPAIAPGPGPAASTEPGLQPSAGSAAEAAAPTNFLAYKQPGAALSMAGWGDMDLASGGPVLIESLGTLLGCGKDGISYMLNMANLGKTSPADLQNTPHNYAKLRAPAIFFTYYWPGASSEPADIRSLNRFYGNVTHHLHGNPVVWDSPDLGPLVYCWGENGNLRAWSLHADGTLTYLACSAEQASPSAPVPLGGMPGGMICVSASGAPHSGIVWALVPYGDANQDVTQGRLLAYDATQFGTFPDNSKQIRVLWDSQTWAIQFTHNKFNRPVVFNGRLYVPTYDARVDVYGLA